MPRKPSFECPECGDFRDITYGCINPLCWEYRGRAPTMDAAPTTTERRSRLIVMTVGELADKRKRAREAQRRWRAPAQAEYLADCLRRKRKPRVWRKRGMSAKMLRAVGVTPL
jgi:hypothetical protein